MHKVLGHIPPSRLALYTDDICIISKTFEEHLTHLKEVFDAISAHGLRIKARECLIAMKEVTFLGHKLNRSRVKSAEQKVQAITDWPAPTSVKEVQVFLGAVGWYRLYLGIVKFTWEKSEEESFQALKHALSTTPVLSYPDINQPFIVTTDASKVRLGGELAQVDSEEQIHPVAYFSRA